MSWPGCRPARGADLEKLAHPVDVEPVERILGEDALLT
jgi:hypothetical protein